MTAPFVGASPVFQEWTGAPTTTTMDQPQDPAAAAAAVTQPSFGAMTVTRSSTFYDAPSASANTSHDDTIGSMQQRRRSESKGLPLLSLSMSMPIQPLPQMDSSYSKTQQVYQPNSEDREPGQRQGGQSWFDDEPRLDSAYGTSLVQAQIRSLQHSPPYFDTTTATAPFAFSSSATSSDSTAAGLQSLQQSFLTRPGLDQQQTRNDSLPFTKDLRALQEASVSNQYQPPLMMSLLPSTLLPKRAEKDSTLLISSPSTIPPPPLPLLLPKLVPDIPLSILQSDHGPHGRPSAESVSFTSLLVADELAREASVEAATKLKRAIRASKLAINSSRHAEKLLGSALDLFHLQGLDPAFVLSHLSLLASATTNGPESDGGGGGGGSGHKRSTNGTNGTDCGGAAGETVLPSFATLLQATTTGPIPTLAPLPSPLRNNNSRPTLPLEEMPGLSGQDFLNRSIQPSIFSRTLSHDKLTHGPGGLLEPSSSLASTDVLMTESLPHADRFISLNSLCRARGLRETLERPQQEQEQKHSPFSPPSLLQSPTSQGQGGSGHGIVAGKHGMQAPRRTTTAKSLSFLDPTIAEQVQVNTEAIFRQTMQVCQESAEEDQRASEAIQRSVLAYRQADHLRRASSPSSMATSSCSSFSVMAPLFPQLLSKSSS